MPVSKEEALRIARADASGQYRDLSLYAVDIEAVGGVWKIDYHLLDRAAKGGGPHYLISIETGEVVSKRYEQ